jgi:alkylation response protein AidB-like acyl-CoA dehydrogenase
MSDAATARVLENKLEPLNCDDLVSRAIGLKPFLSERAADTEARGRIPADVSDQLTRLGLFSVMKPTRFGGFALPPSAMVRIAFELGQACGSTAWCAVVGNTTSWYASYWPLETQEEIWGKDTDNLVSGAVAPSGKCERVRDGYHVSGRWSYASNCDNCDWMLISGVVAETDQTAPSVAWFMIPCEEFAIDHDSWRVSGLQGTGSKVITINSPLFIPAHRSIRFVDVVSGTTPGRALVDNPLASFIFTTFGSSCLAASLLGMSQGALQWFTDVMRTKARVPLKAGAPVPAALNAHIQDRVGAASSIIDAAMALLLRDLYCAESKIKAGTALTVHERVTIRRNGSFAARSAVKAVNLLFEGAGSSSSDLNAPIQRFWRDVNAGARHVTLDSNSTNCIYGQEQFGLQISGQY